MRPFKLHRPDSVEAACAKAAPGILFKAAGIDLIDRLQERVEAPSELVDLTRLDGVLRLLTEERGVVTIGALRTLADLGRAPELGSRALRALVEAAGSAASPQIRNRATIGGNLLQQSRCWYLRNAAFGCAHGGDGPACLALTGENRYHAVLGYHDCVRVHPSSLAPALYVLGAQVCWRDAKTQLANLPITGLYPKDPVARAAEHMLPPDGLLLFVQIPALPDGTRSAYRESREKQGFDWATTAAAVRLRLDGGRIQDAAIALGAVAPVPILATAAAKFLIGRTPDPATFRDCAELAFRPAVALRDNGYKIPVGKAVLADALAAAASEEAK